MIGTKNISYTAAGAIPWKLLRCTGAWEDSKIVPYHLQLTPTNKCNKNCPWCSCSKVDRSLELPLGEIHNIIDHFAALGTKAITVTGGGEPTVHREVAKMLAYIHMAGMKIGLVTNGLTWTKKVPGNRQCEELQLANRVLTWLRLSVQASPEYDIIHIARMCQRLPQVAIGISFTVVDLAHLPLAKKVCALAEHIENLTHIRFVSDILNPSRQLMSAFTEECEELTTKAIFQCRDEWGPGSSPCLISKLKPMIDADGSIYPCCGVQYATEEKRRYPERFKMGSWRQFDLDTQAFDGSGCKVCYYREYNQALSVLSQGMEHVDFV